MIKFNTPMNSMSREPCLSNRLGQTRKDIMVLFKKDQGVIESSRIIINDLEKLITGDLNEMLLVEYSGICAGIYKASGLILDHNLRVQFQDKLLAIMRCWPLAFSSTFIVPSPCEISAEKLFYESSNLQKWTGAYGNLRKQLALFLVKFLKEVILKFEHEHIA